MRDLPPELATLDERDLVVQRVARDERIAVLDSSSGSTGVSAAHPARCVIQIAYSDMNPTNQSSFRSAIQSTTPTVNQRIVNQ